MEDILRAPKYLSMGIPAETVMDLLQQESSRYTDRHTLVKAVRRKLHNIMAPYLEELDYAQASDWLKQLSPDSENAVVREICQRILSSHASSRERIPFLDTFYEQIYQVIGKPATILDLACGFHPFSLPWMNLAPESRFYAYDIHQPRVLLINQFLDAMGYPPLAELRDVLVNPPQQQADAAFLFKETHRMEKRSPGCSRPFWQALQVRHLLVSLPSTDLSGSHDLAEKHRTLVNEIITGLPWKLTEIVFPNEIIFVLDKGAPA